MARLAIAATAVAVVLALASGAASQRAAAPAAAADCGAAVASLMVCAQYVHVLPGITPRSDPPKECCDGLKSATRSPGGVQCLCDGLGKDYGYQLNMTRVLGLPASCGVDPAAFSKCNIKLPGAPAGAPAPTSGSTPPGSNPDESKSAATRLPISAVTFIAAVAAPLLSYYYP